MNERLISVDVMRTTLIWEARDYRIRDLVNALILIADDQGRLKGYRELIYGQVYPMVEGEDLKCPTYEEFTRMMDVLVRAKTLYEYQKEDGVPCWQFINWWVRQRLSRPRPSRIPAPAGWVDVWAELVDGRWVAKATLGPGGAEQVLEGGMKEARKVAGFSGGTGGRQVVRKEKKERREVVPAEDPPGYAEWSKVIQQTAVGERDKAKYRKFLAVLERREIPLERFLSAVAWLLTSEGRARMKNYYPESSSWLTATWQDGTMKGIGLIATAERGQISIDEIDAIIKRNINA